MDISEQLHTLFSGRIERRNGSYVVEIPDQELRLGDLEEGSTYRVAVLSPATEPEKTTEPESEQERGQPKPPVEEGEIRDVDIEDMGEQGDGITRVERGFVVIVPDTKKGERVTVKITEVRQNVAFAEVVERSSRIGP